MNRQLSALMLALFAFTLTNSEARAGNQTIDPNALPQVDFYKHRKKLQWVQTGPEITNTIRNPEPRQILILQAPSQQPQQVQYIMAPAASSPGLPPGAVDLSALPTAAFESNMSKNPNANSKRESLPQGTTTGGLTGTSLASGRLIRPRSGQPAVSSAPAPSFAAAPAQPMAYIPYNNGNGGTGTSGAAGTNSTATVSGKLQRGSLIGKTQNK